MTPAGWLYLETSLGVVHLYIYSYAFAENESLSFFFSPQYMRIVNKSVLSLDLLLFIQIIIYIYIYIYIFFLSGFILCNQLLYNFVMEDIIL